MEIRGYRIFYIDREEGLNDIINIVTRTTAQKVALVVHNHHLLFNGQINLKLIKKYAEKYDKELVFVNPDPSIINLAQQIDICIYPDLEALEGNIPFMAEAAGNEEEGRPKKYQGGSARLQKIFGLLAVMAVLALAWIYFVYPTATVEIQPVVKYQKQEIGVQGSFALNAIDWNNNILPLHAFEVTLTDEDIVQTTGEKLIGETYASGVVKFINEKQEKVVIEAGTKLETEDGITFQTVERVEVPSLQVDYLMDVPVGMKAGQAEVKIKAVVKGSAGNVGTGRIKKLTTAINSVHVINPEPTRGGTDKRLSVVIREDLERVRKNLEEKLKSKLLARIYEKLGGNYRIVNEQIEYSSIEYSFNSSVGEVVEDLKGIGTVTARGHMLRNNELDRLVTNIFKENLDQNLRLMSSGINIENLELAELSDGLYNIQMELVAPVIPEVITGNLSNKLAGLSIETARQVLAELDNIEDYRINGVKDNLPKLAFAIKVVVVEPDSYQVVNVKD